MTDESPEHQGGLWKRFAIVAVSGAATATVALNTVSGIAAEVFPALNHIKAPKGLITPEYNGGPETFLILGSDRREGSKDAVDREDPPHSDTILLVRFDPVPTYTDAGYVGAEFRQNASFGISEV